MQIRMTAVDWVIVGGVVFSVLLGVLRGIMRELVALAGWIAAIVLALHYASDVGAALPLPVNWPAVRTGLGALLIVLVVVFAAGIAGWMLQKLMSAARLSAADRTLGAGFGLLRGMLILFGAVFFSYKTALAREPWWQGSVILPQAEATVRFVAPYLPDPSQAPPSPRNKPAAPAAQSSFR